MGSFLSSFIGGSSEGSSAASDSPDNNRVKTCHSSELLHHYINETSRLVNSISLQISFFPLFFSPNFSGVWLFGSVVKVVIDFSASWCGPCKIMEPIIRAMANEITDVDFVKIDVDELSVTFLFLISFLSTILFFSFTFLYIYNNVK